MDAEVSVVIPCYNDGQYIEECIDSILNQTYRNIEIIIVDDGSNDESIGILKKINRNNIRIFYNDHLGPSAARNFAINEAKGEYILPVDADDKIAPTYVEKAMNLIVRDDNIGAVYCKGELFGEQTGPWDLPRYSFETMLYDNIVFVTALFRKADWNTVNGFCLDFRNGIEDYDFWLALLEKGKKIIQIQEVLFYYRIKKKSRTIAFASNKQGLKDTYHLLFQRHKEFYIKNIDTYNDALRNTIIDLIDCRSVLSQENTKLLKENTKLLEENTEIKKEQLRLISERERIKNIPILGFILQKIYKVLKSKR